MNLWLTTQKQSGYQSHSPKQYTPRAQMPFAYCQDGSALPVVYGTVKTEGTLLYLDPKVTAEQLSLWVAICCGKISIVDIYQNTDLRLVPGINYFLDVFNDGTGAYFPIFVQNASPLHGIAHMFFGGVGKLPVNADGKMPDLRFVVKREDLQSGIIDFADITETVPETPKDSDTWNAHTSVNGRLAAHDGWVQPFFIAENSTTAKIYQIYADQAVAAGASYVGKVSQIGVAWAAGSSYTALSSFVIGIDNNVYQCTQNHTSDYTNQPADPTALLSSEYWQLYGASRLYCRATSIAPAWIDSHAYGLGDKVAGTDGNTFVCTFAHTSDATKKPITGVVWSGFWSVLPSEIHDWSVSEIYEVDDLVFGTDDRVYRCKLFHGSSLSDQPITGGNWGTYWDLASMTYELKKGDVVIGADGLVYRCIKNATIADPGYQPLFPAYNDGPLGDQWVDYWALANGAPWMSGLVYTAGEQVIGTDGYIYEAIDTHNSANDNRPIKCAGVDVNPDWPTYWQQVYEDVFLGNNPAAIAYDLLTNTLYGCAVPADHIDIDSFNAAAAIFNDKKYGMNIKITDIAEAKQVLTSLGDLCDLILSIGTNGKIYCTTLSADAAVAASLADKDFSQFALNRQTWQDVSNEFEAEYKEPLRVYEPASVELKNDAATDMAGGVVKKKAIDLSAFASRDIAFNRLAEIMRRESFPRDSISCQVSSAYAYLRPGDLVDVVRTEYGIDSAFWVVSVQQGKLDELEIGLELVEAMEVMFQRWDDDPSLPGRRRMISPIGGPLTQGKT